MKNLFISFIALVILLSFAVNARQSKQKTTSTTHNSTTSLLAMRTGDSYLTPDTVPHAMNHQNGTIKPKTPVQVQKIKPPNQTGRRYDRDSLAPDNIPPPDRHMKNN